MLKKIPNDERLIVVAVVSILELKVLNFNQRMASLSTLRSQKGI
ncbi:MAG: hypothetical protein ACOX7C_05525 [Brevefilum sp.]|jgi:hypothetical protein